MEGDQAKGFWRIGEEAYKLGKEDPRRVAHAFKVGLALGALGLLHYHGVFFQASGVDGLLSITTVLSLFEYTVGATLAKGLNRLFATCLGVALGFGMHHSAALTEKYSVVIALSVTFIVTIATYCRFFPKVKDMFDECFSAFMASFTVIMVSWNPDDTTLKGECLRVIAIWVAGIVAILICIFVFPTWAGEDLHVGTADNIDRLARYLEAFGDVYFQESHDDDIEALKDYKSVLEYKGKENSLVNYAQWEPRHKKFRCCHPWDQYLVIGSATRECAYKIKDLNSYLVADVQTPMELRMKIRDLCTSISSECGLALKEVAGELRTMKSSVYSEIHIADAKAAAETLKDVMDTEFWPHGEFRDASPAVMVATHLIEIVACTTKILDSVEVLSTQAKFEKPDPALTAVVDL